MNQTVTITLPGANQNFDPVELQLATKRLAHFLWTQIPSWMADEAQKLTAQWKRDPQSAPKDRVINYDKKPIAKAKNAPPRASNGRFAKKRQVAYFDYRGEQDARYYRRRVIIESTNNGDIQGKCAPTDISAGQYRNFLVARMAPNSLRIETETL